MFHLPKIQFFGIVLQKHLPESALLLAKNTLLADAQSKRTINSMQHALRVRSYTVSAKTDCRKHQGKVE